jgi:acetyltransferase-like isoleucine patch superfamily enzyme
MNQLSSNKFLLGQVRLILTAISCLILPSFLARAALNVLGHSLGAQARIGFSFIWCKSIHMSATSRIGHFNFINIKRIVLREKSWIGRSNILNGPFSLHLKDGAVIGNRNKILRARSGISIGSAEFRIGKEGAITSDHRIDCTQSVFLGAYSFLAGAGSQLWSHGYIHASDGPGRYRVDGRIEIGDNVYIGSACIISMGIKIANSVIVGAGTSIARDLLEPGLYVSAPIRALPRPAPPSERTDLLPVDDPHLVETVYIKTRP